MLLSFLLHLAVHRGIEHIVLGLKAADAAVMLGNTFDRLCTEAEPLMLGREEFAIVCTLERSGEGVVHRNAE